MANLVGKNAEKIKGLLGRNFKIDEQKIKLAVKGDAATIKEISQKGIEGAKIQKYAPQIAAHLIDSIQGVDAENKMYTDIYKAAGKVSQSLTKYQHETVAANTELANFRTLQAQNFVNQKKMASEKMKNEQQYLAEQARVRYIEMLGNHEFRMQKLENQIPLKQMQADREYMEAKIEHYLEYGDASNDELIPAKEFTGVGVFEKIKNFFSGK